MTKVMKEHFKRRWLHKTFKDCTDMRWCNCQFHNWMALVWKARSLAVDNCIQISEDNAVLRWLRVQEVQTHTTWSQLLVLFKGLYSGDQLIMDWMQCLLSVLCQQVSWEWKSKASYESATQHSVSCNQGTHWEVTRSKSRSSQQLMLRKKMWNILYSLIR